VRPIPDELRSRPFTRNDAIEAGVTPRMLQGARFVRVHPGVYRCIDHEMSHEDDIEAARLALPDEARTTGLTRLRRLGLDFGPASPLHFVVEGDLHLVLDGVFLHRTVAMPPADDEDVDVAAAFLAYCAEARVIDAIKVGDWLLHHDHVTTEAVAVLATAQPWRAGAAEALWILPHLNGDARSLPESETRVILAFAGLPEAEVNQSVDPTGAMPYKPDLYYRRYQVAVEYEGAQHQEDREVYGHDIDRYGDLRRAAIRYVQVTKEKQSRPRKLVGEVYRELLAAGYDGPPPDLGAGWRRLFRPISELPDLPTRMRRREAG
jgi:hypothetical protein